MEHHDGAVLTNRFAYVYQLAVLVRKNDRRDSFSDAWSSRKILFRLSPTSSSQFLWTIKTKFVVVLIFFVFHTSQLFSTALKNGAHNNHTKNFLRQHHRWPKKRLRSNLFLAKPYGPPRVRQAAESYLGNDRLGLHEKDRHH